MCRTGVCVPPLDYVTCHSCCSVMTSADNAGCWSCALAHYNGTPEYNSSEFEYCFPSDYESVAKKSRRIKFSWPLTLDRDGCILRALTVDM